MKSLNFKTIFELLKQTYADWSEDKAARLGAALAYYTIFSIAPLLLIIISVASLVFHEQAQEQIMKQIGALVGQDAAMEISEMLMAASQKTASGIVATAVGIITLLAG